MTEHITGAAFSAMIKNASAAIDKHKTEVNELNVFPVPDGDTGTNMSLTMGAAARAVSEQSPKSLGRAAEITSDALLRGARGNSGVILSLLFRGLSRRFKDAERADAQLFALALSDGVEAAYRAVQKPTEGTILTVSRLAAAAACAAARETADIEHIMECAISEGKIALADTINLNPVLKKAGVIDSGGKGYIYILDGMLRALRGEVIEAGAGGDTAREKADFSVFSHEDLTFGYEIVYVLELNPGASQEKLIAFLNSAGDSVVTVGDEEIIKVHVHTDRPGDVLTDALKYGSLQSAQLENLREQQAEKSAAPHSSAPSPAEPEKKYGMVTVCSGDGLAAVFRDLGADQIITGGQTMNPSTDDILAKIEAVPAEIVFVFPNNKNIIMAAEQCVPIANKKVVVIPAKSIPQGVSAMLAFDPDASESENFSAMSASLARVRTLQITHAARDSTFDGFDIRAGEYLALLDDCLVASGQDFAAVAERASSALSSPTPEFLTVFLGEDATETLTASLTELLGAAASGADLTVVTGGQPVYG
ncbi:MAG: DAK2 domain-containing protein, partial [Oscillospiraceae bacterium]|nr:DAK2 domain-containing protein [Oscillospiraceae bacterium]